MPYIGTLGRIVEQYSDDVAPAGKLEVWPTMILRFSDGSFTEKQRFGITLCFR